MFIKRVAMNLEKLKLNLLYVEDDVDTRERLSEVLRNKVQTVYVAKDGVEALELFGKHTIHLIISDFQMPNMNGNELCTKVKEINPLITFILLTAFNHSNLLIESINSGVDKFLQKPINSTQLFSILDKMNDKVMSNFQFEKSMVCLKEAEQIALLSYWDLNLHTKELHFSEESKELFGLSGDNITYKTFAELIIDEDKIKFLNIFERRIYIDQHIDEIIIMKKNNNNNNNQKKYLHLIAKKWESLVCGTQHVIGLFQDVTRYEVQMIKLLKESQSDPMLKISNKRFLIDEVGNLIKLAKRYGHSIGTIFFDIDNFKKINDNYGHLVADDLLIELVDLVSDNIRQSDYFGRWGGDEFVIVTGYSSPDSTIELANKLLKRVNSHLWSHGVELTISIGVAFYEAGDSVSSLINKADIKMLEAKQVGKNQYCL